MEKEIEVNDKYSVFEKEDLYLHPFSKEENLLHDELIADVSREVAKIENCLEDDSTFGFGASAENMSWSICSAIDPDIVIAEN